MPRTVWLWMGGGGVNPHLRFIEKVPRHHQDLLVIALMNLFGCHWLNTCPVFAPQGATHIFSHCGLTYILHHASHGDLCVASTTTYTVSSEGHWDSHRGVETFSTWWTDQYECVCLCVCALCRLACGTLKLDSPWRKSFHQSMWRTPSSTPPLPSQQYWWVAQCTSTAACVISLARVLSWSTCGWHSAVDR